MLRIDLFSEAFCQSYASKKNKHPALKAECLFFPLGERHGQDEDRAHEVDRGEFA